MKFILSQDGKTLLRIEDDAAKTTHLIIPEGVEIIGEHAFSDNSYLQNVTFPSTLKIIEEGAFRKCKQLRRIILFEGLTDIGKYAFAECEALTDVAFPQSLLIIGKGAFLSTGIKCAMLPPSVSYIGSFAFANCSALLNAGWECGRSSDAHTTAIGASAFEGCAKMDFMWPDNLIYIGDRAFAGCVGMRSVRITSLCHLGTNAFENCALKKISVVNNKPCIEELFGDVEVSFARDWNCTKLTRELIAGELVMDNYGNFYTVEDVDFDQTQAVLAIYVEGVGYGSVKRAVSCCRKNGDWCVIATPLEKAPNFFLVEGIDDLAVATDE